jgi:hypothetical protein
MHLRSHYDNEANIPIIRVPAVTNIAATIEWKAAGII